MVTCDKCGKPVDKKNDVTVLDARCLGNPIYILMHRPRHLFPTESCEGSPSRAQYLGGPPDTRGEYEFDPELVPAYQAAYAKMKGDQTWSNTTL